MAEDGSWTSIKRFGLLSTTALLDLFGLDGEERAAIECARRPENVALHHDSYGSAVIRDQKPLRESALVRLLDDMTPQQYYKLLNGMTFFWVRKERLETLLGARAYRAKTHIVLTIDTLSLVKAYSDCIYLSRINSGAAIYNNGRRGKDTFTKLSNYPFEDMRKKYRENAVVELAVKYAVREIERFTVQVEQWSHGRSVKAIWKNTNYS